MNIKMYTSFLVSGLETCDLKYLHLQDTCGLLLICSTWLFEKLLWILLAKDKVYFSQNQK